jgi:hypothetical protein
MHKRDEAMICLCNLKYNSDIPVAKAKNSVVFAFTYVPESPVLFMAISA